MIRLKKKNKNRKRKVIIILSLLIYFSSFTITIKFHFKDKKKLVNLLLENSNYVQKKEEKKIVKKVVSYIANVDFNNPLTLINNNYNTYNETVKKVSKIVKDDTKKNNQIKPIVYLYNTHQKESYSLSNNESYNIKPTVMTLSYIIREKLNKNNIPTIVEENNVSDVLNINNWNYAASYKVSRMMMEEAKKENSSLKYFIDLHRDSVGKKISTVTINNKKYAKVLFIVGLENPNYQENLQTIEKINSMIDLKYPNLSRGIYKKKGKGVNGVYNQDFSSNTILIEVGGEENTIDEVYNTALVISNILTEYIRNDLNEK